MSKVKTKVFVVTHQQPVPQIAIRVDGEQLKQVMAFKYLEREVQARLHGGM